MRAVTVADDPEVNILAFFKVVASSQISPHSETVPKETVPFSAAKIHKKSYMPTSEAAFIRLDKSAVISNVSKNRPKISKKYYLRSINITPIKSKRYESIV